MHILTKILVVAVSLFSVLLASLTTSYSISADEIRRDYLSEKARADRAMADLQNQADHYKQELGVQIQMREQALSAQASAAAMNRQLESQLADERAARARAETELDSIRREGQQALETVQTLTSMIDKYREEVRALREADLRHRENEIALLDRINDLEARNDVLEDTRRSLAEQLAAAQERLQGETTGGATPTPTGLGRVVTSRVIETFTDKATGQPMARIEVGTNDGVRVGTEFTVSRDGQFLAVLTVIQADLQTSLGRIDTLGKPVQVRTGDQVITK